MLGVLLLLYVPQTAAASVTSWRAALLADINAFRSHYGLHRLYMKPTLQNAAQAHSGNMARYHMLSHSSSNGTSWITRIRWYGFRGRFMGEDLAVGPWSPGQTLSAWAHSAPHRANLLNGRFWVIGIGVARGTWSGHAANYVTADFGG